MKKTIFFMTIVLFSLTRLSNEEKLINDTLGTKIQFDSFDYVQHNDLLIPFNEFRNCYKYIYLVYLQNGCGPCYPKYMEWQTRMDSLTLPENFSVLFLFHGQDFNSFLSGLSEDSPYLSKS